LVPQPIRKASVLKGRKIRSHQKKENLLVEKDRKRPHLKVGQMERGRGEEKNAKKLSKRLI